MCMILAATGEATLFETIRSYGWMFLSVGVGLGFVIFVHELGHFLVAKACGVKCEKFYIGFDIPMPKVLGFQIPSKLVHFQWGETEYGVGILPLGGYVKMLGQDDDPRNAEKEAERIKLLKEGASVAALSPNHSVETGPPETQFDPRSFPAKSVPARMAIISAGVIMNLIFAVLMAAVAYRLGVPETPATIGGTSPGGPAWVSGIEPGARVLQLGKSGSPYEHVRWEDLIHAVAVNGFESDVPVLVRTAEGKKVWHTLRPSDRLKEETGRPMLGVLPPPTREIIAETPRSAHLAAKTSVALKDRDQIVAVDGQALTADWQLTEILTRNPKGPLKLTIERTAKAEGTAVGKSATDKPAPKQELEVTLEQRPMRDLGVAMKIGPIVAVREGSPADEAGFLVGDLIEQVNGQPVGDPLLLGQRLALQSEPAEPIEFTVTRTNAAGKKLEKTLSVTPVLAQQFHDSYLMGGPSAIESMGVAFDVTRVVSEVTPEGPAAKAGLQPEDVITQVEFIAASEEKKLQEAGAFFKPQKAFEPLELNDTTRTWSLAFTRMQLSLPDTKVKLTWVRKGQVMTGEMTPTPSETFFDESRGLEFYTKKEIHQVDDWSSALSLGFRETKDRLHDVFSVLGALVTGRVAATNLMGPMGIMQAAGSFASQGVPKMLIFLTLLSANLAVLNFLPIPALDGGHMLFLTAEWIRGKPVDERLQIRLTVAGVLALLSLMVFATAMDIGRWFG
ncbi:MAG: site-2 protease family protein [Pirellulaceae bacterium]